MIQDMINSENSINTTESTNINIFKIIKSKSNMEHPHFPNDENLKNGTQICKIHQSYSIFSKMPSQQLNPSRIIYRKSILRNIKIHCKYIKTLWQTERTTHPQLQIIFHLHMPTENRT